MNAATATTIPLAERRNAGTNSLSRRWAALGEAGAVVRALAGLDPEHSSRTMRNFPALIQDCPQWRRDHASCAIADLAAIMEPGITALLAVNARGADPRPPAQALWREFSEARGAILDLLPPSGALGHRRYA